MIILCDIDNCISNDLWRHEFINWSLPQGRQRYHSYHSAAAFDTAHNLDKLRVPGAEVIFLTAMPQEYAVIRENWLAENFIKYSRILYRQEDHHLNSIQLKRNMIHQLRKEGIKLDQCIAAYDDRRSVIQMFIEEGLPGIHLQITEQEHLHRVC